MYVNSLFPLFEGELSFAKENFKSLKKEDKEKLFLSDLSDKGENKNENKNINLIKKANIIDDSYNYSNNKYNNEYNNKIKSLLEKILENNKNKNIKLCQCKKCGVYFIKKKRYKKILLKDYCIFCDPQINQIYNNDIILISSEEEIHSVNGLNRNNNDDNDEDKYWDTINDDNNILDYDYNYDYNHDYDYDYDNDYDYSNYKESDILHKNKKKYNDEEEYDELEDFFLYDNNRIKKQKDKFGKRSNTIDNLNSLNKILNYDFEELKKYVSDIDDDDSSNAGNDASNIDKIIGYLSHIDSIKIKNSQKKIFLS